MTDDTIRAALDAATRTGCNCDCAEVQPGCRRQMAEEIAAFLRALPERRLEGIYGSNGYGALVRVAAAVEEASRHE